MRSKGRCFGIFTNWMASNKTSHQKDFAYNLFVSSYSTTMSDRGRARSNSRDRSDRGDSRGDSRADRSDRGDKASTRDGPEATTSLLVRNLSYRVRADEIRRIFARYGDIRDVYIPQVKTVLTVINISTQMCKINSCMMHPLFILRTTTHKDLEDLPSSNSTIVAMLLMLWITWTDTKWTAEKLPLYSRRTVARLPMK